MSNILETASRLKLRFATPQGTLSTEDLWDLPLVSERPGVTSLDGIYKSLAKKLQDSATPSLAKKPTRANDLLKLSLDIVVHIFGVLQAEADSAEELKTKAERKQVLLEALADASKKELSAKSTDELRAELAAL